MVDESKPIKAKEIVNNPDMIMGFMSEYLLITEYSPRIRYSNALKAMNVLSTYGWETINTSMDGNGNIFALIRNTHYKNKNS